MIQPRTLGFVALAGAILGYGGLWPVTKIALETVPPFWFAALRMAIAIPVLLGFLALTGRLRLPTRHDLPLVLSVGFFMMAFYTTLMQIGLQFVDAGRAALLGYTTPIWVLPAAYLLLGERPSRRRVAGLAVAMTGLVVLFNPAAFDWSDRDLVIGNALLLCCALSWSVAIIHIRRHTPMRSPIQLAPFQLAIAMVFLTVLALLFEPLPALRPTATHVGVFAYGGVMGTAVAMMSVTTCVRYLPTAVSTVGLLGAPVFALSLSAIFLGEALTAPLIAGVVLILGGIALVSLPARRPPPARSGGSGGTP